MLKQRKPAKNKSLAVKSTTIPPIRITPEEKQLIYEASSLSGQSISQFIINNVLRVSQNVIAKNSILLDSKDYEQIFEQNDFPSESENEALKDAFSRLSSLSSSSRK